VRHQWILFPALLLASPVWGQTPTAANPPMGANLVQASTQAQNAINAGASELKAALEAELAQKNAAESAPAPAAIPTAQVQMQNAPTAPEPSRVSRATSDVEAALRSLQNDKSNQQPDARANEQVIAPAAAQPANNQAATDALARALTEQAQKAAETAAFADMQALEMREKANNDAFDAATRNTFPLSPDQIKEVMRRFEDTQYAVVPPSYGQPKGEVAVTTVSLDPGAEPPQIDVAVGYVTTMAILDATGQPWPIQDIGVGGNFDVPVPEAGSHIIRISPMTRFGYGNLSIRLRDLATPVTFRVSAGNDTVHYRYDARIPRMGPNAKLSLIQKNKIVAGDDTIMAVLDNAIPAGTKKLKVTGTDKRTAAYMIGERVFVRTPLTLLSPSWDASVSSADGTTVYEVGETPVLLLSDQGQMIRAKISDDGA
jgi:intracellular multiplication protein IcmK